MALFERPATVNHCVPLFPDRRVRPTATVFNGRNRASVLESTTSRIRIRDMIELHKNADQVGGFA